MQAAAAATDVTLTAGGAGAEVPGGNVFWQNLSQMLAAARPFISEPRREWTFHSVTFVYQVIKRYFNRVVRERTSATLGMGGAGAGSTLGNASDTHFLRLLTPITLYALEEGTLERMDEANLSDACALL